MGRNVNEAEMKQSQEKYMNIQKSYEKLLEYSEK